MFKTLRFSLKKSKILGKIRKAVQTRELDAKSIFEQAMKTAVQGNIQSNKDIYIEELINLISKDETTLEILKHHNKNFDDVRNIIKNLELNGAGQIVKGHYVAVSAIAFVDTLDLLCKYWNKDGFNIENEDRNNSNKMIAYQMLKTF